MSSAAVCATIEALPAQPSFDSDLSLEDPTEAVSSYARIMHEHTQRQMQAATKSTSSSSSRRTVAAIIPNLQGGDSVRSSLSSQGSH